MSVRPNRTDITPDRVRDCPAAATFDGLSLGRLKACLSNGDLPHPLGFNRADLHSVRAHFEPPPDTSTEEDHRADDDKRPR
jgi:hypothetical protein